MIAVSNSTFALTYSYTCSGCGKTIPTELFPTFAQCKQCGNNPLIIQYDIQQKISKSVIDVQEPSMWRYRHFLPLADTEPIISLGEGWTPIRTLEKVAKRYGFAHLLLKDESLNPTGSFKARGLSMAITKAKNYGIECCIIPTAGNAGGAMSAYCAKADIQAIVVMPAHTPAIFQKECVMYGAEVVLVKGLINDCAQKVAQIKEQRHCFDLSTMKEPYRLEGKKTMGYEIAEQLNWTLPDVILYPTGGGTGLIGIWKAFKEMQAMGWISGPMPKMIAIQAENCQPLALTFAGLQKDSSTYKGHSTIANGLAVPNPFAERLMLNVLHESGGTVVSVSEQAIRESWKVVATTEGLLLAPEGAAMLAALKNLQRNNILSGAENILLLNTGTGYKYLENLSF